VVLFLAMAAFTFWMFALSGFTLLIKFR
jgi:hypothetical protein